MYVKRKERAPTLSKEDLRKMGLIQNTDGMPRKSLTDEAWQMEIELRKKFLPAYPKDMDRLYVSKTEAFSSNGYYKTFINDTLKDLKKGLIGYCFYIYQIEELLKFYPKELKTKYDQDNECFIVWLGTQ